MIPNRPTARVLFNLCRKKQRNICFKWNPQTSASAAARTSAPKDEELIFSCLFDIHEIRWYINLSPSSIFKPLRIPLCPYVSFFTEYEASESIVITPCSISDGFGTLNVGVSQSSSRNIELASFRLSTTSFLGFCYLLDATKQACGSVAGPRWSSVPAGCCMHVIRAHLQASMVRGLGLFQFVWN